MTFSTKMVIGGALLGMAWVVVQGGRRAMPKGVKAIKPFDKNKYLGKWYEIARLDFKHERNLNNTTANYSQNEDGSIKVINQGFNYKTGKTETATGKARFTGSTDEANLKVSFFGPFYSGYHVIALDPDYRYAMVAGKNLDYLWLLSREKSMPEHIKEEYLSKATDIGFKVSDLVWVQHDNQPALAGAAY